MGSVSGRVGDTVSVPVQMQMDAAFKVGAISLSINYDSTRLRCAGSPTNILPALSAALIGNCGYFSNLGSIIPTVAPNSVPVGLMPMRSMSTAPCLTCLL
ncbi:MAG: hypothetical protein EBQ67_00910 [Sphingobacteriia bacterium]|nr:hypothetical protein [Sphingobacteriia bacterium]